MNVELELRNLCVLVGFLLGRYISVGMSEYSNTLSIRSGRIPSTPNGLIDNHLEDI